LKNIQYSDKVVRAYGLALTTSYLLDTIGFVLKKDSEFYSFKNKMILNQLIQNNAPILNQAEKLRRLVHPGLDRLKKEVTVPVTEESSTITEELDVNFGLVRDFTELMSTLSPKELSSFGKYMQTKLNKAKK